MYNQNSGYGQAVMNMLASKLGTFGRVLVVFNPSDTADENYQRLQEIAKVDPNGDVRFFTTIEAAYTAAKTNNNDVILINAHSNHYVAACLAVSKNRIHFIGMGTWGAADMQPEVALETAATVTPATMKVTGYGNTFTNLYFTNNGTDNTSLAAVIDAGENTVYTNCSFSKQSDLDQTLCANVLAGGDTTTWRNCKFGVEWLTVSAARASLLVSTTSGGIMKHNIFEDCYFIQATSSNGVFHIKVAASSLTFSNIWKNCIFMNPVMTTGTLIVQTKAVSAASAGVGDGTLFFVNPATNSTDFCTDSTKVYVVGANYGDAATSTATIGIGIVPA